MNSRAVAAVITPLLLLPAAAEAEPQSVTFVTRASDGTTLTGYLYQPETSGPAPAIVALHGCGGLLNRRGDFLRIYTDWAERFTAAGYVVLFPDSFRPRGVKTICDTRERPVVPRQRAADAAAAADWLAQQPFVDPQRIAVVGWSNGGSSVLWAANGENKPSQGEWRAVIAFYPGCGVPAERADWAPRLQPYVLIGSADDWTPAGPCRVLAERGTVRLIEYVGAVHGFDAPNTPRRTRTGVAYSARGDGNVEIGTDPKARAASIKEVMTILREAFR